MEKLRTTVCIAFTLFVTTFSSPLTAQAQIVLDFTGDTYFANNPVAEAALQAAVADINAAVNFSCLDAITDDVIFGVDGGLTAAFDFRTEYTNPADGLPITVQNTTIPAGQINIYAGARTFGGNILGQGGPAGTGLNATVFGVSGSGSVPLAVADAVANEQHSRNAGPVIANQGGLFDLGMHTGTIAFDDDASWHFDHTTAVAPFTSDFYSVALHELLHAIGIGGSDTWNSLVSGSNYLGTEGIAANGGSGTGLISSGGDHLALNVMSSRISDGLNQVAVLDPTLLQGTRRTLTELDLALLRDIGYKTIEVSAVPEPSCLTLLVLGGMSLCCRRRKLAL